MRMINGDGTGQFERFASCDYSERWPCLGLWVFSGAALRLRPSQLSMIENMDGREIGYNAIVGETQVDRWTSTILLYNTIYKTYT